MNIDRINISNGAIDRTLQSQDAAEAGKAEQSQSGAPDDAICLSSGAKDVERIGNMLEQSHNERLSQVREAISNGTYRVSGEDIARKLIQLNEQ